MLLDRKNPPPHQAIEEIEILKAEKTLLNNGVQKYQINAGSQDLLKLEFVFKAGSRFQEFPLVSYATNNLLLEGTSSFSSEQIAYIFDYHGAFIQTDVDKDYASVTLYTLNKHLSSVLPALKSIITQASFPKEELDTFIQNEKQRYLVDEKKVSSLSRRYFNEMLFGSNHPYGYRVKIEDYDNLTQDMLLDFYNKYYHAGNSFILVAGKIGDKENNLIQEFFGKEFEIKTVPDYLPQKFIPSSNKNLFIQKDDALQSAIRIGRIVGNKKDSDYFGLQILNAILGGYFGSRLMTNIREEKGYTYGISSAIISMQESGIFVIATEVGAEVCRDALNEIYFELERLRNDLVPDSELDLVKNYMLGLFLKNADGPFALSERARSILEYDFNYDYYHHYINTIKNITSTELNRLANKYFQKQDLFELVVGKK